MERGKSSGSPINHFHNVIFLETVAKKAPQPGKRLLARAVWRHPVVKRAVGQIGYDVRGDAAAHVDRLQLFGEVHSINRYRSRFVRSDSVQQAAETVQGVSPRKRSCRVRALSVQFHADAQGALTSRLHHSPGWFGQYRHVGPQEI